MYKPEFVDGEILVCLRREVISDRNFAKVFGRILGYELKDEEYKHGDLFIYKTKVGKESNALKIFNKHKKFVDWAARRDLKIESRWENLEQAVNMLEELHDDPAITSLSDDQYASKLATVKKYLDNNVYNK